MMAVLDGARLDYPVAGPFPEMGRKQVSKLRLSDRRRTKVERSPTAGELCRRTGTQQAAACCV